MQTMCTILQHALANCIMMRKSDSAIRDFRCVHDTLISDTCADTRERMNREDTKHDNVSQNCGGDHQLLTFYYLL